MLIPRFKRDKLQYDSTEAITLDKRTVNKIIQRKLTESQMLMITFVDKTTGVLFRMTKIFPTNKNKTIQCCR